MTRPIFIGLGAAVLLLSVYFGIMTLTEGISGAMGQASGLWYWIAALTAGFGTQAALYSYLRQGIKSKEATTSVATSGSVSTGSMVACCAHHLSDVLPMLGLAGLSVFLVRYQVLFIVSGVLSNVVGIAIMLESIQRHLPTSPIAEWKLDLGKVKIGASIMAPVILAGVFFLT